MYSENNLLERLYLIGGPPRVGKSVLSAQLASRLSGHLVSTDSIVTAAKKACSDTSSDLFILNAAEDVSDTDWLAQHRDQPQATIEKQNRESFAAWNSIHAFCNSFVEDDLTHIVEGVHLLPSMMSKLKNQPKHLFFVGNTNPDHGRFMLEHARMFPEKDWMGALEYSDEKILAMGVFVNEMSRYFKSEAEKFGFQYFETDDTNFEASITSIVEKVL